MANHFSLLGVKYDTIWIPGGDVSFDNGLSLFMEPSGTVPRAPAYAAINESKPVLRITTPALTKAWDAFGTAVYSENQHALVVYYARAKHGYTDDVDTNMTESLTVTANNALIVLESITATQGQPARMTWAIYGKYTGTTYPFTQAQCTLPTVSTTAEVLDQLYTCGPVGIEGTLQDTQSVTVNCGCEVESLSCSGAAYPDTIRIKNWAPTAQVDLTDNSLARTYFGSAMAEGRLFTNNAGLRFHFKKISKTIGREADTSEVHFRVVLGGGTGTKPVFGKLSSRPNQWGQAAGTRLDFSALVDGTGVWPLSIPIPGTPAGLSPHSQTPMFVKNPATIHATTGT